MPVFTPRDIWAIVKNRDDHASSLLAAAGRLIRPLAIALLLGGLAACAGTQIPKQQITTPGQALFNGQVKTDVNCYSCHNGDGSGTLRGPNLAKRVPKLTDQEIAAAIASGPGLMPSFKDKVTDEEVKEITAWLRSRFPQ
jgi:mono/diheme cytochrome c family protein